MKKSKTGSAPGADFTGLETDNRKIEQAFADVLNSLKTGARRKPAPVSKL